MNVYKRFLFFYKNRIFNVSFYFPNAFYLKKTLNSKCENKGNLKQKVKNQSSGHKIIADFVFTFTYF